MDKTDILYKPTSISQITGIPVNVLNVARFRGNGPKYIKIGRSVYYRLDDVKEWIEQKVRFSTSDSKGVSDERK